jgi:NADPH-ferrihemoprotein reductase
MLEVSGTTIFGLFGLVCFVIYLAFFSDSSSSGGGGSAGERSQVDDTDKAGGKNGGKAGAAQKKEAGPSGGKGGPRPKLDIFYGSQTGTAEGFARELAQGARSNNFDARAVDLENFTPDLIQECRAAVFLVATYGEGEPTDNSKAFVRWLKKGASAGDLDKLHYCVFGLGSTNYELYNTMGTLVDKKLDKFGGNRVLPLSLGDEVGPCSP